ncbi:putative ATPase [Mucilaginibacter sp. SG538B]|uniref:AAA family ATPase n=1 Tax=Mucilaginibacter sp. SG538B TaxID=2587021 RepID=UPI00159D005F|nr:AAA family ATPase [Mucilaginibacter sp. SG538B]NVM64896.1 putative ATPase [Mucilaginibacter sp. SG538B]
MFIEVIEWANNKLYSYSQEPSFYLERDDWDDYHYRTSYYLHLSGRHSESGKNTLIGHLKILKEGQQERESYLIPLGGLKQLDDGFCSLGQSLDYYERIAQLDKDLRNDLFIALRDIVIFPDMEEGLNKEPGFEKSLLRFVNRKDDIFSIAPLLISRDFNKLLSLDLQFDFKIPDLAEPITFDFNSPTYGWNSKHLPNRIAVIIGRNGSGKSTLLAKISRIAFASASDRSDKSLQQVGVISPAGLGFPRIINLAYSAFDSFQVPGIYINEKELIVQELKEGLGRYIFCGIRDIVKELEDILPNLKTRHNGKLLPEDIIKDRHENSFLKPVRTLAEEFCKNLDIISTTEQIELFPEVMEILAGETSMHTIAEIDFLAKGRDENFAFFMELSTGHKFVFHALSSIVALTTLRSLLLFDEPETHLHPPILAVLMQAIRHVLERRNSFMIVATHSPVVLQETLKRHVFVVRREGSALVCGHPEIQTFGENIGLITATAFGLSSEITDYHLTLDKVIGALTSWVLEPDPDELIIEIEKIFDQELSMQARAYILTKLYAK